MSTEDSTALNRQAQKSAPEESPGDAAPGSAPHTPRHPSHDPGVSIFAESDTELLAPDQKLVVIGYTHRTAPLAVRSRFAVAKEDLPRLSRAFHALPGVGSCILLATCNRLEAYLEIRSEAEAEAAFVDLVGGRNLHDREILARSLMVRSSTDAVRHLFRVASGLDAMVLGDAQILGQAKEAYKNSCTYGTAGPALHKAFHAAFRCAKNVRTETALGDGAQSVAGSAVSLLARELGGLGNLDVLLVGVNEMTEAAGKRLAKSTTARLFVCNRTTARASELAGEIGGVLVLWSDLMLAVERADAVVTCTGAVEPIFSRDDLVAIVAARGGRPLTVVDIAVPPDVKKPDEDGASAATDNGGLRVLDLEDVGAFQEEIEQRRCQAASAGERIVTQRVSAFSEWLQNQTLAPKMSRLREEVEQAVTREIMRAHTDLSPQMQERMEIFGKTLIKRFLGAYRRIEDAE